MYSTKIKNEKNARLVYINVTCFKELQREENIKYTFGTFQVFIILTVLVITSVEVV